ncbi:MAG TPA: ribulose-phosphate 3-epimerase [Candidatus Krumholzibacteria bacterium]|jgi:ribulose-phosphate 3-epimerase
MAAEAPQILASLRSAKLEILDDELAALEAAGIDGYHLDVMDGRFVAEECFDADFAAKLRPKTRRVIDVHLIAERPESLIDAFARAGADRISFHWEATADAAACVGQIRAGGARPGIVCLPSTELEVLRDLLQSVALVNPLGVDPTRGLGFQENTYQRIETLRTWRDRDGLDFLIQADGGVWEKTRDGLVAAGADELVGGYPIFSAVDYGEAIVQLRHGRK